MNRFDGVGGIAALLIVVALFLMVMPTATLLPALFQSSPPVDVVYETSGLVYESGIYYHRVVLHNRGTQTVTVVAIVKILGFSPQRSQPVEICPSCTTTVRVEAVQPSPTQTQEQRQSYIDALTKPQYVQVENASSPLHVGEISTEVLHRVIQFLLLASGLLLLGYYERRRKRR